MRNVSLVVGLAAVTIGTPALAHSHNHSRHTVPIPVAAARSFDEPRFVRVGPNGYWVTTTWGCYTDEGQGRIQDCDGMAGGGGA